jgi:tetratricopeptide (TPR) repeat protein
MKEKLATMVKVLRMRSIISFLVIMGLFILPTKAQILDMLGNPQITLNLVHPPNIGLKVTKLAFGPATGRCSDQVVGAIIKDLVNNNIEVIDRSRTASIFQDNNIRNTNYVDQNSAASLLKILGPSSVIVYVNVERCNTQQDKFTQDATEYDSKTKKNVKVRYFFSKTQAHLRASVQTVDLATGRTFVTQKFDYAPERVNKSPLGYPEFPSEIFIQDVAFNLMADDVHRMFLSWTELTKLYFYDDKECGLKLAFQALKINDLEQAFILSQEAIENCKNTPGTKEKVLGHANYNMGMCYFIRNEYDKALEYLRIAAKLRPGAIVNDAITGCMKARDLAFAMQQIDNNAAATANINAAATATSDINQPAPEKAAQPDDKNVLTNKDIIDLTNQKLPKAIIIQKIKSSKCKFDTSSKALVALNKAGVNQDVIVFMMSNQSN